jgi:hypothetical protein
LSRNSVSLVVGRRLFVAVVAVLPAACTLLVDTSGLAGGTIAPGPDGGGRDEHEGGAPSDGTAADAPFDVTPPSPPSPPSCGVVRSGETLLRDREIQSCNENYHLILQGDGNLVLYADVAPHGALWATDTYDTDGDHAVMQADGNLVLFGTSGTRLFETHTNGSPGAYLDVTDDGKLAVIGAGGIVWSRP